MNKTLSFTRKDTLTTAGPGVLLLHVPDASGKPDACDRFEQVINRALAARPRLVIVDLSDAESVSTVMLGLLLKLRRGAVALGGEVRLVEVQPMVRRVLDICRLDKLFGVFSTAEAAMEASATSAAI